MTLIKLSEDHYVLTDDSEICIGDIVAEKLLTGEYELFTIHTLNDIDNLTQKKVTHSTELINESTQPNTEFYWNTVNKLSLSEVKELLGVVDKAFERYPVIENDKDHNDRNYYRRSAYYQALEDNKEKKYTEEDLRKAISETRRGMLFLDKYVNEFIQSLQPKTEWEVEFVDGKLKLKS